MSLPVWTKDEQSIDSAKDYLRQGGTVDFFELISRSILQSHPSDLAEFALNMVNDIIEGKEIATDGEYHPKKLEDSEYLHERGVSQFLDKWILALLEARPGTDAERMGFHKQYLQSLSQQH